MRRPAAALLRQSAAELDSRWAAAELDSRWAAAELDSRGAAAELDGRSGSHWRSFQPMAGCGSELWHVHERADRQ